jgi:hypothetical protein
MLKDGLNVLVATVDLRMLALINNISNFVSCVS